MEGFVNLFDGGKESVQVSLDVCPVGVEFSLKFGAPDHFMRTSDLFSY